MPAAPLSVIRPVLKLASRLAPRAVGRAAFTLFCTPQHPKPNGQAQLIGAAEARLAGAERLTIATEDGTIAGYLFPSAYEPARGTVALVHGWLGRAAFMTSFVEPLRQAGYAVALLDLPAHGASSGKRLHMPCAVGALVALHRATGPWTAIVAHSFGGAIATTAIAGGVPAYDPIRVDKLVMVAAPNSMPQAFRQFGRVVGLSAAAQEAMENHVAHVAGRPLESFVGADYLEQTKTPTLVIHARDDKEVPFADAQALAAAGDFVALKEVRGLGHRRILYAPQVTEMAARFVAKPSPVAADDAPTRRLLLGAA